jgi:hypothetical protein
MAKSKARGLREQAKKWTCNQFAITDHKGDTAKLLRKAADAIEQLGEIEVLNIVFRSPEDPSVKEITVSVYFYFPSEDELAHTQERLPAIGQPRARAPRRSSL